MSIRSIYVIAIFFSYSSYASPDKIDSLKFALGQKTVRDTLYLQNLLALAINIRNESIEQSQAYFKEAIALSDELEAVVYKTRSLYGLGICYGMLDQYAEAIQYFNEALTLALQNDFKMHAGNCYNSLGIVYKRLGDYSESLSFYSKAMRLYDSLNDEEGVASCHENMGVLFDLMKEPSMAMEHYQKSKAFYEKKKDLRKLTILNSNIAMLHLQAENYAEAIQIYEANLDYYRTNNLKNYEVQEMASLGYAYYKIKAYHKADPLLVSAYNDAATLNLDQVMVDALYTLSKSKGDQNNFKAAIRYARRAQSIADSTRSLSLRSKSQELLSYCYQQSGDPTRALEHFKIYKSLEDSLFNENKLKTFKSQQVLMEVHEKDQKIEEQSFRLAALNKQVELENRWNLMLGMASISLLIAGILYYQKYRTRIKYSQKLETQNELILEQKEEIETINHQLEQQIRLRKETDDTINYFAASLFGKNSVDEILWDVAKNCIARLGLVDCVIYLVDQQRNVLVQKAAYGSKNPEDFHIHDPIEIQLGHGIVGSVAQSGVAEIVNDTTKDPRYIVDDEVRLSELAVPLIIHNRVIGIIDTEHPEKNFYSQYHLDALSTIASICASKISQAQADEQAIKARESQREADQIKKLDQLKSQFFANISHEFRTPLHLILAPLQKKQPPSEIEIEMMGRNAKRLLRLVNQLLDLAKIEVGLSKVDLRNINVCRFVTSIANSFISIAEIKDISYRIRIPERDHVSYLDPDKVEKIVYNLLSNAFKFTPKEGTVDIDLIIDQHRALYLKVSDNGIGIPENLKENIFRRFYQVDGSSTRDFEGSGIGLALTKELVDLLGGTIEVKSVEGIGSTFTVYLPINESFNEKEDAAFPGTNNYYIEAAVPLDDTDIVRDDTATDLPLVLMVEDNQDLLNHVKSQLSHAFNFIGAANGQEGLDLALKNIPDLIITDIMMPIMDGVVLTKRLREDDRTSHIPIILLTARDDGETKIKGFETGAEQYVVKPFEIAELSARIKSLLLQRERLRNKFSREVTLRPSDVVVNNRDAVFLEKIIQIIENNLREESFTIEDLQSEIGMSRMQLHRKLKALTNQSASDFVRTIKLKRAAQLLQQSGTPVAEAAFQSGFNHLSYFTKCFKEQFGVLPSEYSKATADT